jgi:hypothetical protein
VISSRRGAAARCGWETPRRVDGEKKEYHEEEAEPSLHLKACLCGSLFASTLLLSPSSLSLSSTVTRSSSVAARPPARAFRSLSPSRSLLWGHLLPAWMGSGEQRVELDSADTRT